LLFPVPGKEKKLVVIGELCGLRRMVSPDQAAATLSSCTDAAGFDFSDAESAFDVSSLRYARMCGPFHVVPLVQNIQEIVQRLQPSWKLWPSLAFYNI
jgi:hypothetical protein